MDGDDGFQTLPVRSRKKRQGQRPATNNKKNKNSFSSRCWSKPTEDHRAPSSDAVKEAAIETRDFQAPMATDPSEDCKFAEQTSLTALLEEYGEQQDRNEIRAGGKSSRSRAVREETADQRRQSRLMAAGKAPIHVELTSFGYRHGDEALQSGVARGHGRPLPTFDCREAIDPVPSHMQWMDGRSGAVRQVLLRQQTDGKDRTSLRRYAQDVAEQAATALAEAIDGAGYGYAQPLHMVIAVGSEHGRHRSVVCCEQAATFLRQKLRENTNNRFQQPCSVGTRHIHLEQKSKGSMNKKKQMDLEGEW